MIYLKPTQEFNVLKCIHKYVMLCYVMLWKMYIK